MRESWVWVDSENLKTWALIVSSPSSDLATPVSRLLIDDGAGIILQSCRRFHVARCQAHHQATVQQSSITWFHLIKIKTFKTSSPSLSSRFRHTWELNFDWISCLKRKLFPSSSLHIAPSLSVASGNFLFGKSSFMCGLKMKGEEEGKTFHHSTTGKTLSNQERLNMIKISSPSSDVYV